MCLEAGAGAVTYYGTQTHSVGAASLGGSSGGGGASAGGASGRMLLGSQPLHSPSHPSWPLSMTSALQLPWPISQLFGSQPHWFPSRSPMLDAVSTLESRRLASAHLLRRACPLDRCRVLRRWGNFGILGISGRFSGWFSGGVCGPRQRSGYQSCRSAVLQVGQFALIDLAGSDGACLMEHRNG